MRKSVRLAESTLEVGEGAKAAPRFLTKVNVIEGSPVMVDIEEVPVMVDGRHHD
jgi:hypothetical protein